MRNIGLHVLLAIACLIAIPGFAEIPAVTLDNTTGQLLTNGPFTLGWEFVPNRSFGISALGVFDDSQNGLMESHPIGIWDSNGTLLFSTTVAAGACAFEYNQFCYAQVGFELQAGQTYEIGALWNNNLDALIFPGNAINFSASGRIRWVQNSYIFGSTLSDPTNHQGKMPSYFGPNFIISTEGVPEPGSILLVGSGLLGMVGVLRRRLKPS
jgi:hypothetical protein